MPKVTIAMFKRNFYQVFLVNFSIKYDDKIEDKSCILFDERGLTNALFLYWQKPCLTSTQG